MDCDGTVEKNSASREVAVSLLRRLARDRAGNTLALIAAATAPMLALIGGGIDMSRSYLAQARLQQACDAGVLAARKKLGAEVVTGGEVPAAVIDIGNRFFDLNYRDGAYGTEDVDFNFALEENYSISGEATVNVPTTIMAIFGNKNIPIRVGCEAMLNFSDTDVMFVLDTTGSMSETNPDDVLNRMDSLRQVVKDFHAQLEGSKSPQTRVRYGFVPYSTNVNVGGILEDDWVVDTWAYQTRERITLPAEKTTTYTANWLTKSGEYTDSVVNTYAATYNPPTGGGGLGEGSSSGGGSGSYSCKGSQPSNTVTRVDTLLSETTEPFAGPPSGTRKIEHRRRVSNLNEYWTTRSGTTCTVRKRVYDEYTQEYDRITDPVANETWRYDKISRDVSNWRTQTAGCMEERATYAIASAASVDLTRALDLDLDTVPTAGNPDTQWRPMYPDIIFERKLNNKANGTFQVAEAKTTGTYFKPAGHAPLVACPAAAQKLQEMDASQVDAYLGTMSPNGQTYHDIGMIWGGRLLSSTGLFAAENQDQPNKKTSRHLIFLTDGHTEALDIAYGAYGVEPLDRRRWTPGGGPTLNQTIEMRFGIACNEVKKRNITVWVVGFGTTMTDAMKTCAGEGHWFQADDAEELAETFSKIAKYMAELRVSR